MSKAKDYRWRRHLARCFGVRLTGDIPERLGEIGLKLPLNTARRARLSTIRNKGILFIHIPKNAGTSLSRALYGHAIKHDTVRYYERFAPDLADFEPSFAVLRDPVERFLSAYRHAKTGGCDREVAAPFRDAYLGLRDVDDALDHVEQRRSIYDIDHIFRPQTWYITRRDGTIGVRHLVLLHQIDRLPRYISRAIEPLPHENCSSGEEIPLTPEQIARIRILYREDVALCARFSRKS